MATYEKKDNKLDVTESQSQQFTLEQIDELIANTTADKARHDAGSATAEAALEELQALKEKAIELGVEPAPEPVEEEPEVVEKL